MKKTLEVLGFSLLAALFILFANKFMFNYLKTSKIPEIGSRHIMNWESSENPFAKPLVDTLIVIDFKEGYVLYESRRYGSVSSTKLKTFNFLIEH